MTNDANGLNQSDALYIAQCLGRTPKGLVTIAARDALGKPAVMCNHPLQQIGERCVPQPTLYWLVDPALSRRIAEIERKGGVREIEADLQADEALMRSHLEDNAAYAEMRWAMLSGEEQHAVEQQGLADVIKHTGIGGIANHAAIKCLHAQYAYHLAKYASDSAGTTVGQMMQTRYTIT